MQCYGTKNVAKGEQFCLQNFDPVENLEAMLLCYESIPLLNQNYCDIKHTDNSELVACYRENAKLTLDKAFCDL